MSFRIHNSLNWIHFPISPIWDANLCTSCSTFVWRWDAQAIHLCRNIFSKLWDRFNVTDRHPFCPEKRFGVGNKRSPWLSCFLVISHAIWHSGPRISQTSSSWGSGGRVLGTVVSSLARYTSLSLLHQSCVCFTVFSWSAVTQHHQCWAEHWVLSSDWLGDDVAYVQERLLAGCL